MHRNISKWIALSVATCTLSPLAHAGLIDLYYQQKVDQQQTLMANDTNAIAELTFTQWIDHTKPATGTFNQRYYIDETFSTSNNAPVFFYICGEAACSRSALSGAIRTMAEKYHAKLIALEHRYYGVSSPYQQLTTTNLKYLTIDNALKDLARFQQSISKEKHWTGKWITFGGSYPGSLSAYYRLKYPNLTAGSLASSAPVMAKDNFEEYDAHVTKVAGAECANNMRRVVKTVEDALSNDAKFSEIKHLFGADDIRDNDDVLSLIAEIGAGAVQYGMRDLLCTKMSESTTPIEGYADVARTIESRWGIRAVDLVAQGAESENVADYENGIGARQWYYQSCKEYGYWQTANADVNKSTRSSRIDLNYYQKVCQRLFGLNEHADTQKTNALYYTPLLNETTRNIFFTNGANDPWSTLSLTEINGNNTNPNLSYFLIDGAAHCDDLRAPKSTDSAAIKSARSQLDALIANWV